MLAGFLTAPAVLLANPVRLVTAAWARARVTTVVVVARHRLLARPRGRPERRLGPGAGSRGLRAPGRRTRDPHAPRDAIRPVPQGAAGRAGDGRRPVRDVARVRRGAADPRCARPDARTRPWPAHATARCSCWASRRSASPSRSTAPTAFYLPVFDRYLLALIPLAAIFVLRSGGVSPGRRRPASAGSTGSVALVALAGFGIVTAANSASFDGAKWAVARDAARQVGGPRAVDGGFEWNSFHAGGLTDPVVALRRARGRAGAARARIAGRVGPRGLGADRRPGVDRGPRTRALLTAAHEAPSASAAATNTWHARTVVVATPRRPSALVSRWWAPASRD